jgi:hypothetical protein
LAAHGRRALRRRWRPARPRVRVDGAGGQLRDRNWPADRRKHDGMKNERKGQSWKNVTRARKADDAADIVEGTRSLARCVRPASLMVAQLNRDATCIASCAYAADTGQSQCHALQNKGIDQNACGHSPPHALRSLGQAGHGCPRRGESTRVAASEAIQHVAFHSYIPPASNTGRGKLASCLLALLCFEESCPSSQPHNSR